MNQTALMTVYSEKKYFKTVPLNAILASQIKRSQLRTTKMKNEFKLDHQALQTSHHSMKGIQNDELIFIVFLKSNSSHLMLVF